MGGKRERVDDRTAASTNAAATAAAAPGCTTVRTPTAAAKAAMLTTATVRRRSLRPTVVEPPRGDAAVHILVGVSRPATSLPELPRSCRGHDKPHLGG